MASVENFFETNNLSLSFPKPTQAALTVSSIIHQYYSDIDEEIIFDKNRGWTAMIPYIGKYFKQNAKVIVTVRNIDEILTSMIAIIRKNPYKEGDLRLNFVDDTLVKRDVPLTDDNRCDFLLSAEGFLGQALTWLSNGLNQGFRENMHFVEYKDLVESPNETLKGIYNFLGEEPYQHTFQNIQHDHREKDKEIHGIPDLHEVRPELKSTALNPTEVLSPLILDRCKDIDFWRHRI
jgi:sulfotransferase